MEINLGTGYALGEKGLKSQQGEMGGEFGQRSSQFS